MYCDKIDCTNNNKKNGCIAKDNSFMWCGNAINRMKDISDINKKEGQ